MAAPTPATFRELLAVRKPAVPSVVPPAPVPIKAASAMISADNISDWADFSLAHINTSFCGGFLDTPLPHQDLDGELGDVRSAHEELGGLRLQRPEHARHLLRFTDNVSMFALNAAKTSLDLLRGVELRSECMEPGRHLVNLRRGTLSGTADYCVRLEAPDGNLVVGLARPSSYWKSERARSAKDGRRIAMLCRLATACVAANTRYGFIETEREMTVCRFTAPTAESGWRVEMGNIPWANHGTLVVTTELALWWLCMMAMADPGQRALSVGVQGARPGAPGSGSASGSGSAAAPAQP